MLHFCRRIGLALSYLFNGEAIVRCCGNVPGHALCIDLPPRIFG